MLPRTGMTLCVGLLLSGCYQYVTAPIERLRAGDDVRLHLSEDGVERLRSRLEASPDRLESVEDRRIEGRVTETADQEWIVEVPWATVDRDGFSSRYLRQRLVIRPRDVLGAEVQQLERSRTVMLVVGIATAASVVVAAALTGDSGGGGRNTPGGPDEAVILRFMVGWR